MLVFLLTRSYCHLTIIILIYWNKIDHVLLYMIMIDSWETVHYTCFTKKLIWESPIAL